MVLVLQIFIIHLLIEHVSGQTGTVSGVPSDNIIFLVQGLITYYFVIEMF
jgi:hypothetical protein